MERKHVYVFVRKDLNPVEVAVQVGHVCVELGISGLVKDNPHIILIGIKSEAKLLEQMEFMKINGVNCIQYVDKSMGQLTALASEPVTQDKRHIFAKFKLLQRESMKWDAIA